MRCFCLFGAFCDKFLVGHVGYIARELDLVSGYFPLVDDLDFLTLILLHFRERDLVAADLALSSISDCEGAPAMSAEALPVS